MKNEYSEPNKHLLRFGIPSLDDLFGGRSGLPGIDCGVGEENIVPTSICITGPDGTGKSVLALHLAAHYAASQVGAQSTAKIIYISTDLTHPKALSIWKHFALDYPLDRPIPFGSSWRKYLDSQEQSVRLGEPIELRRIDPTSATLAEKIFAEPGEKPFVAFVDLASGTAGDDWGLVAKIVSLIEKADVPHLVVLDAIEGLEAYVGDMDAFGLQRSRRSRVAQVLRAASKTAHVCLVVEESNENSRLAEDYICDVVLRLRATHFRTGSSQHLRRTIEIEKARAQAHARGQHSFSVRDGRGTKTGNHYHPSDPCLAWVRKQSRTGKDWATLCLSRFQNDADGVFEEKDVEKAQFIAYVQIFPSLEFLRSRAERTGVWPLEPEKAKCRAGFGIPYLDDMLPLADQSADPSQTDHRGLSFGTTTILIGEEGTHRGGLVRAFLGQCFKKDRTDQAAIILHFQELDVSVLASEIEEVTGGAIKSQDCLASNRLICQKLPIRDCTSGNIYHMMLSAIREAKRRLGVPDEQREPRIRFVLGNTAGLGAAYPDVLQDHLFFLGISDMLSMEGVTALLIHTDRGAPTRTNQNELTIQRRGENRIYTWHVPFFGEDRVAIAAIPPIALERSGVIREVRVNAKGAVEVDPHFEMYSGLAERRSETSLVPLRIRLWSRDERFKEFMRLQNQVLKEVFAGLEGDIVSANEEADYDAMRSVMHLRGDTKLNDTLVVQIDEFWRAAHNELLPMAEYLSEPTCKVFTDEKGVEHYTPILGNDPSHLFQPTMNEELHGKHWRQRGISNPVHFDVRHEVPRRLNDGSIVPRALFFDTQDYNCLAAGEPSEIDRVPYTWDFGMMMLKRNAWEAAKGLKYSQCHADPTSNDRFAVLGEDPAVPSSEAICDLLDRLRSGRMASWREFLRAAASVARMQSGESAEASIPFDVDMTAPESLNCLVLEVWASTIRETDPSSTNVFAKVRDAQGFDKSLYELIKEHEAAFYRAWILLGEALAKTQFGNDWFQAESRPSLSGAVAAKHWYSTASCMQAKGSREDHLEVVRLPGNYAVRGDWFLAIAHGSLSPRLGQRAIDLLCSRRANAARLQEGIGLPTRDLGGKDSVGNVRSALIKHESSGGQAPITYGDLLKMGKESEDLNWLWRYTIRDYDRHSGIFLKMNLVLLARCSAYWSQLSGEHPHLRSGYQAYDYLRSKVRIEKLPTGEPLLITEPETWPSRPSYNTFVADCEPWLDRMKVASSRSE